MDEKSALRQNKKRMEMPNEEMSTELDENIEELLQNTQMDLIRIELEYKQPQPEITKKDLPDFASRT